MIVSVTGSQMQLVALNGWHARARAGESLLVLIEGEAGIGKTTLFDGLLEMASERGFRSMSCRPTRSEMELSYVGLLELLDGIGNDVVASLPPPQARVYQTL